MKVKFNAGDKVFAKVRGYPYWPAKIIGPQDESASKIKYDIVFYGTGEKAVVKAEDVQPFMEKRLDLGRPKKQKAFNDAMAAIENDLSSEEIAKFDAVVLEPSSEDVTAPVKKKSSVGRPPKQSVDVSMSETLSTASSETKPTRGRKRKSRSENECNESSPVTTPETSRTGRKIRAKRLSEDSPVRRRRSVSKKRSVERMEDIYEFEYEGVTVVLPLNIYKPPLTCPKSKMDWNYLVSERAADLKDRILEGNITLDDAKREIEAFTRVKAREKKKEYEENERDYKILKIESKLLQLDVKIKASLTLAKARPGEACKYLEEVSALPVTALMLKKHPEIFDTFKRLSRYIGNTSVWNMSDIDKAEFSVKAEDVRNRAQSILDKFKDLFEVPEGQSFSRIFSNQLRDFNLATQKLSQDDFFSLVKEPVLSSTSQGLGTKSL